MGTVSAVAAAVVGITTLVWGVLRWFYGTGSLEKTYYDTLGKLKGKQNERTVAMQKGNWASFHLLTTECIQLSESANSLRVRLKACGVTVERPEQGYNN